MEITNENKAKVFAQYLGQLAITTKKTYTNPRPGVLQQLDIVDDDQIIIQPKEGGYYLCSVNECKLILKPLSAITDEDFNECWKTISKSHDLLSKEWLWHHFKKISKKQISECIDMFSCQYLISKGYDLPHHLLGGKTLHESGLAIYEY